MQHFFRRHSSMQTLNRENVAVPRNGDMAKAAAPHCHARLHHTDNDDKVTVIRVNEVEFDLNEKRARS